jgi:hypothetical protein
MASLTPKCRPDEGDVGFVLLLKVEVVKRRRHFYALITPPLRHVPSEASLIAEMWLQPNFSIVDPAAEDLY